MVEVGVGGLYFTVVMMQFLAEAGLAGGREVRSRARLFDVVTSGKSDNGVEEDLIAESRSWWIVVDSWDTDGGRFATKPRAVVSGRIVYPSIGISGVEVEEVEGEEGVTMRVFADIAFFFGVLLPAPPSLAGAGDVSCRSASAITGATNLIPGCRYARRRRSIQEEWLESTRSPSSATVVLVVCFFRLLGPCETVSTGKVTNPKQNNTILNNPPDPLSRYSPQNKPPIIERSKPSRMNIGVRISPTTPREEGEEEEEEVEAATGVRNT